MDAGSKIPVRIENLPELLNKPLENEAGILDALLMALAKGQHHVELWQRFHDAGLRDDKLTDIAFAYERIAGDRRLKIMPPANQAIVALHNFEFCAECFGDLDGAIASLERALAAVPGHSEAFAKLVEICARKKDKPRLIQLHLSMATPKVDKETQLHHLREALALSSAPDGGDDERTVKIAQQILKLDPTDSASLGVAEQRLAQGSKFSEIAKLLEQAVQAGLPREEEARVRGRLIEVYDTKLAEIEKATPHLEELLAIDPNHLGARRAAQKLLTHKVMAPRAAAAMEKVFEAQGDTPNVAKMLAVQVEQLRGPKKVDAQKRLALLAAATGDIASALANLEAVVLADLNDEEARMSFVAMSLDQGKAQDAARVLSRAAAGAKESGVRGRINAELGRVFVVLGDPKKAKQVLANVIDTSGDDIATLNASRAILPLYERGKESKQIATTLDVLSKIEPHPDDQVSALMQLAEIGESDLGEANIAIGAFRRVMEVAPSVEARDGLERLLEACGRYAELAESIEGRAKVLGNKPEARQMLLRAAQLRQDANEQRQAIDILMYLVETFGPAHDVHEILIPLLTQAKMTPELLTTLAAEARIVSPEERAPILGRIAQVKAKQRDTAGALEAFGEVLALAPEDPAARAYVENALKPAGADAAHRLRASEILHPIYKTANHTSGLVAVLSARAELTDDAAQRLKATSDAFALAKTLPPEDRRALELAENGLLLAIAHDRARVYSWVDRTTELERTYGVDAVMQVLVAAMVEGEGYRPIDDAAVAHLARSAAQALVECGESKRGLELYRALLAYDPQDNEVLTAVDNLLEEQGSPADRVKLYEAALERHKEGARRRELFHKIGMVQRRDLADVRAAITTYERALEEFPGDKAFRGALYAAYEVAEAWDELHAALARALTEAPAEERPSFERRLADVSLSAKKPEQAARHFRAVLDANAELAPAQLDAVEKLATDLDDPELLRKSLEQRLANATETEGVLSLLERLGDLEATKLKRPDLAIERYSRAAKTAEEHGDTARELAFHDKTLALEPGHRPTLGRIIEVAKATGDAPLLVKNLEALLDVTEARGERVALALAMEAPRISLGDRAGFVRVLDTIGGETGPRLDLLAAEARAYGDDEPVAAAAVYRTMLTDLPESDLPQAATLFEAFLGRRRRQPEHREDVRSLFAYRAKEATGDEKRRVLFAWAQAERDELENPARALTLARELLAIDPNDLEALELESSAARRAGDFESAARSIERRARMSEGDAKHALLVELSEILMTELKRPGDALDVAEDLLASQPTDPAARSILERALQAAHPLAETTPEGAPSSEVQERAGEMLERLADQLPTGEERAKVYEELLLASDGGSTSRRAGLYKKLLADQEASPERALGIALRAVGEFPEEEELWSRSEDLARTLGAADRVSMAYRQVLAQAKTKLSPEAAMTIGQRGVDFQEEWFDDQDAVAHMLKLVVDVAPEASWAFERLKLLYNAGERWEDLFLLYDRVIEGTQDPGAKIEILEDAAEVAKDLAGDPERAMRYLEQLHVFEPRNGRTTASLERLYERHAKHKPLIALLSERVPNAQPADRSQLRLRMAVLHLDALGEIDEARVLADTVLSEDPANVEAEKTLEKIVTMTGAEPRGLAKLKRTVAHDSTPPASTPISQPMSAHVESKSVKVRKAAALSLKSRYMAAKKPDLAARMIDVALEEPGPDQVPLLRELFELEKGPIADRARAFETLALLAYISPADAALRKELTSEADELGNHERLVDALLEIAERCSAPEDALPILEQASSISKETLNDHDRVISIDLRILARTDQDPVRAKEAAQKLDRELQKSGREAERCSVLERLAELEQDKALRGKTLHEVARIAQNVIGDPARAAKALRQRLDDEPDDIQALSLLIENLRAAGDLPELATMLARRVEILDVGDKRRSDLVELARIRGGSLDDRAGAIAAFERVIAEHGADDEVADELAATLRDKPGEGDHGKLAGLLASEAARANDANRAGSLYASLGKVHSESDNKVGAAEAYARALDKAPSVEVARTGLEGLVEELASEPAVHRSSVAALERAYKATGAWERSLALVPERLFAAETDAERVSIYREAAELEEHRAREPGRATVSTWKAFCLAPDKGDVASELLRRTRLSGQWDVVAPGLLEALSAREVDPSVARDLLVEASDWALRDDPSTERAVALLEAALKRSPGDVEALSRLVEAHRRSPSKALCTRLVELADAQVDRADHPDSTYGQASIECLREAVTVALKDLEDKDEALLFTTKLLNETTRSWEASLHEHSVSEAEACRDAASFAIDIEVVIREERGDRDGAFRALVGAAKLPFERGERRSLFVRATEFATSSDAIDIYRSLFEEDPHDADIVRELESRYLAENRRADVIAVREKQIAVAPTIESRLGLRLALASLYDELGQRADAERVLGENLGEAPTHAVSVGFLARLLDGAGKYRELASLWESQARAQGGAAAIDMWDRAAQLRETQGDLQSAMAARKQIVDLAPTPKALDDLARLLEKGDRYLDAAAVLERLVETLEADSKVGAGDPAEESVILRLATDYEAAGKRERALQWLERSDGPHASPELRGRLRVMYRSLNMLEPLAALLAREAESAPDPKTRLARLKEAAAIFTTELDQPQRAIPLLEELIDLDKTDLVTRLLLSDALRGNGRYDAAREILTAMLEEYGTRRPKERALVHFELAKVALSVGERTKAMAELEAASKIDQTHAGILQASAKLALEEGQLLRAQRTFRALLLVVRSQRAPAREQAFAATPSPELAGKALDVVVSRAEVLVELAAIAEQQGEADRKQEFIESAFEAARESSWEAEQLTKALAAREWHDLAIRILEERVTETAAPADRVGLLLSKAELLGGPLGRASEALDAALAALDLEPASPKVHEIAAQLARITDSLNRYADALSALSQKHADKPLLALDLSLFEARTKARDLEDHAGAREAYQKVLSSLSDLQAQGETLPVTRLAVLSELEPVLEKSGDHSAHVRSIEEIIELGAEAGQSPGEQAAAYYKLSKLHLGKRDADAAVDALERATGMDPDPDHVEQALRDALPRARESLRLARLFEDFCRAQDRKSALVDALVAVADREDDPRPTLREAYELSGSLLEADPTREDGREPLLVRIVEHTADSEETAWALVALGERRLAASKKDQAADLLARAAKVSPPDEERALLMRVAKLAEEDLEDDGRAVAIYEELRARDPADREVWTPLARIQKRRGDVDALSSLFESTIPLIDEPSERATARVTLAELLLEKDPTRATDILREALDDAPGDPRAGKLLAELYTKAGDKDGLAMLLEKRLDVAKDKEDKPSIVALSMELGKLREEQGEEGAALEIYNAALDWDPNSRDALRAVVALGMKRDDSVGVGDELDRLMAVEEGPAAVELAFKVAEMKRAQGDEPAAERALAAGMKAHPADARIRQELRKLYTARSAQSGSKPDRELLDLDRVEATLIADPIEKKQALLGLAERYKSTLEDEAAAGDCLIAAHEADPSDRDVLFTLMDTLSGLGKHDEAIEAVNRALAVDTSDDPSWFYFSRAVLREANGETESALADLEAAHEKSGRKYGNELKAQLEAAIAKGGLKTPERALRLRLAEVMAELGEVDAARGIISAVLRSEPQDKPALRSLAQIDETTENYESAVSTLRRLVPLEEGDALVDTALRLSRAAELVGQPENARQGLERALKIAPADERLRTALKAIYLKVNDLLPLATMIVDDSGTSGDNELHHARLVEASQYLLRDEAFAGNAFELLERAKAIKPDDVETQLLVADAHTLSGRPEEGTAIAEGVIAAFKGRRTREVGRAYYSLHRTKLRDGNLSDALEMLSKAFDSDPQNARFARELGDLAVDLDDAEIAQRAFRSITLMKQGAGPNEGPTTEDKSLAYFHLGRIAVAQGDRRRAKLMLEKALTEDPAMHDARALLDQIA